MPLITYHAPQEQFAPSQLLTFVKHAEGAGFDACHTSDHFHPWSKRQGHSGLTIAWLGAAMQATKFPFSFVNAPGQRYHPAIVAQALATLSELYPGRLDVALGSGEALNECITGDPWPEKPERNIRLLESVQVIRRLLNGDTVTHEGLVKVKEATLYTRPKVLPRLFGAALTEDTARWAGDWADGLIISYQSLESVKRIIRAFQAGGGEGKPIHLQVGFSYARSQQLALEEAHHQWRSNTVNVVELGNLSLPEHFDEKTEQVTLDEMHEHLFIFSQPQAFIPFIKDVMDLGLEQIILHNIARQQEEFINDFGRLVLPDLKTL